MTSLPVAVDARGQLAQQSTSVSVWRWVGGCATTSLQAPLTPSPSLWLMTLATPTSRTMNVANSAAFCAVKHHHYRRHYLCRAVLATSEMSVRPSVRLSVKRANCDKTKELYVHMLIPHKRPFILLFWQEEWLMGQPLLSKILGQTGSVKAKRPIFNRYSLIAPQP